MSAIDVSTLLEEVSPEQPSGEDLEYDSAFIELELATQGKAEQELGEARIEGEEPDWDDVKARALDLLGRTKDLRAAIYLARAGLKTDGLTEFADALELIHGYLERYWDSVHPQLDPSEDNDPTMRVNILSALTDTETMLRDIRQAPLSESRIMGRFSLRDMAVARGDIAAGPTEDGTPPPDPTSIDAAFRDSDPEVLRARLDAIERALDLAGYIESTLTAQVGAASAMDFSALSGILREARDALAGYVGDAGAGAEETEAAAPAGTTASAAGRGAPGAICTPEDVRRMLDSICEYYQRTEPSSPLPLLLERAKRLVAKDFMTILADLAPDGLDQAKRIGGIRDDEEQD